MNFAYLAENAKLNFSALEEESLKKDLKEILEYVEKLQELETSKILPLAQPIESHFPQLRRDELVFPTEALSLFLENAPQIETIQTLTGQQYFFKVPGIFEK